LLEPADPGDGASRWLDLALIALILANVAALILETVAPIRERAPTLFARFESVSLAIFAVEYLLRIWSATADPRYAAPVRGRLRWATTPVAIADLLAVLPVFLTAAGIDLRGARLLRVFRLLLTAKLGRYSVALQTLGRVVRRRGEELITMIVILAGLLVFAASLLYFAERNAQPDSFASIPAAMWWAIVTLTTVGYGDVYPITPLGRIMAGVIAVLGVGTLAFPTALLGAAFLEETRSERSDPGATCPHCGEPLPDRVGNPVRHHRPSSPASDRTGEPPG
jgi:voltage-gated potassium channel